jgi:hypothetical protein
MLQINEQIKLYTIYTNTVNRQMELAGRTNYQFIISLQADNLTSLSPYATDLTSDR